MDIKIFFHRSYLTKWETRYKSNITKQNKLFSNIK